MSPSTSNRPLTPFPLKSPALAGDDVKIPHHLFKWHGGNYWWHASFVSLAASFLAALATFGGSNSWPSDTRISPLLSNEPIMAPTSRKPFYVNYDNSTAIMYPIREYTQAAMVTSMSSTSTGWIHVSGIPRGSQVVNPFDGTVVWGRNITTGVFRKASYYNDGFYGHLIPKPGLRIASKFSPSSEPVIGCRDPKECENLDPEGPDVFRTWEFANNHYLPSSPAIRQAVASLQPGDQILLRGPLVLYTSSRHFRFASPRDPLLPPEIPYQTKEVEGKVEANEVTWRGFMKPNFYDNGCELIFVEELRILGRHNRVPEWILKSSLVVTGALFTVALGVHFFAPRY